MNHNPPKKLVIKQQGFALLMLVFLLTVAGLAGFMNYLNGTNVKIERDNRDAQILAQAKDALIGYSIGVASDRRPGDMLVPDYFASTESPKNYDGNSDFGCMDKSKVDGLPLINSDVNMRCLGRLPWKTLGLYFKSISENDSTGEMPWYAVSGNLVDPTCVSVLNPNILNLRHVDGSLLDCSGLPYPWLTVRDSKGNLLSNRVAVVIFLPGLPHDGQARLGSPNLGGPSQYLDKIFVPSSCSQPCIPGSYSNADLDNDYILASESSTYARNTNFNDKLIYISIDELIRLVTNRSVREAEYLIDNYYILNSYFPYPAKIDSPLGESFSDFSLSYGSLPIDRTNRCGCVSGALCSCSFGLVRSVAFRRASGTAWTSSANSCSFSGATCTCTGAGSCSRSSSKFTCNAEGDCGHNITGNNSFKYTAHDVIKLTCSDSPVGCSEASSAITCVGVCNFDLKLTFASWFKENLWQANLFYDGRVGKVSRQ